MVSRIDVKRRRFGAIWRSEAVQGSTVGVGRCVVGQVDGQRTIRTEKSWRIRDCAAGGEARAWTALCGGDNRHDQECENREQVETKILHEFLQGQFHNRAIIRVIGLPSVEIGDYVLRVSRYYQVANAII